MKKVVNILLLMVLTFAMGMPVAVRAEQAPDAEQQRTAEVEEGEKAINPKKIIFEHLGDGYGWEVPFNHHKRMPLPVIVYGKDGFHCFMSSRIAHGQTYRDGNAEFRIAGEDSPYHGKVVEIVDGKEYKPWDISITKNVCALLIAGILLVISILAVARWHRQKGTKAPRGIIGALESLITFIYDGVIKPTMPTTAKRYAPYLLTVFFFILYMNLLGLIVVFPGGANLTGNIAVTLVLALFTFVLTNTFASGHYWKEILWPDVPIWLKCPIPIMQVIEIFGMFTKPAALTIRLFANMMGGHMIVIVLTLLIFILSALGAAACGAATVVSVLFSIFMLLIDTLVSFIQAYVFTMLSTIFIAMAHEHEGGEAHAKHDEATEVVPATR